VCHGPAIGPANGPLSSTSESGPELARPTLTILPRQLGELSESGSQSLRFDRRLRSCIGKHKTGGEQPAVLTAARPLTRPGKLRLEVDWHLWTWKFGSCQHSHRSALKSVELARPTLIILPRQLGELSESGSQSLRFSPRSRSSIQNCKIIRNLWPGLLLNSVKAWRHYET